MVRCVHSLSRAAKSTCNILLTIDSEYIFTHKFAFRAATSLLRIHTYCADSLHLEVRIYIYLKQLLS